MNIPTIDGQVLDFTSPVAATNTPRIYYVNGVQTDAPTHAQSATVLSLLTERTVFGVYNASAGNGAKGMLLDLLQCGADWTDIFLSKLGEIGSIGVNRVYNGVRDAFHGLLNRPQANPANVADQIRQRIPVEHRVAFIEWCVSRYNKATASLFQELRNHQGQKQIIVAHSQGNLITADALWSMVVAYGEGSLANMQIYSLASPTPAWPLGIRYRRKVYGHTNDLVTLCDPHNWSWIMKHVAEGKFGRNAGDWRQHGGSWMPGLGGHDINRNIALNFSTTIRRDLGLPPLNGTLPRI